MLCTVWIGVYSSAPALARLTVPDSGALCNPANRCPPCGHKGQSCALAATASDALGAPVACAHHDAVRPKERGRADDGAQVLRIHHLVQREPQRRMRARPLKRVRRLLRIHRRVGPAGSVRNDNEMLRVP